MRGGASEVHDTWSVVETSFDVELNRHYESILALGSGPLQQRASLEEGLSDDPQDREYLRVMGNVTAERFPPFKGRVGTFIPGITGPHPTCGEELINLPALHGLVIYAGHERLDMQQCAIEGYRRRLNLRNGLLSRELLWKTRQGSTLRLRFERFISAQRRYLMAQRCELEHIAGPSVEVRVIGTLDADVRTNGFDHFENVAFTGEHEPITVEVHTNGGDLVAAASIMTCTPGVVLNIETETRWAGISGVTVLDPGATLTVSKFAAMTSSRHVQSSPLDAARNITWNAAATGFEALLRESDALWRQRWEATDVVIEGDAHSQLALRTGLYHLLRAAVELDPRVSIDPKAFTSEAYAGRVFWDTDIFMLPVFLYTRPDVAKVLARFRIGSLEGARRNAQRYHSPGARYAWESAPAGDEHCPNWQYADHEIHITADVVYGLWHTYLTNNEDWHLLPPIAEVLIETARYWSSRVTRPSNAAHYELIGVMGPDEYTLIARNNAYTNAMASAALRLAVTAWRALRVVAPSEAERLAKELHVGGDELKRFAEIADGLRVPTDAQGLVLQSDDFFTLEPLDFGEVWTDRSRQLAQSVPQERLYRSRALKQADVLQLMALWPGRFHAEQIKRAYHAYEPICSHDSSLSRPVHALVAAWIGNQAEALRQWDAAVRVDLTPGRAADGVHAACAGGLWQAAVFGFGGVASRMQSEVLTVSPRLPQRWKALRFPLVWAGQALYVTVEQEQVTIEHRGTTSLPARVADKDITLEPGCTTRVPLPHAT